MSGFVCEPCFGKVLYKHTNGKRFDLLLLFDDDSEDLGTGSVVLKVSFDDILELNHNVREHRLSYPIEIVAVKVSYRETILLSFPNPVFVRVLTHLETFPS